MRSAEGSGQVQSLREVEDEGDGVTVDEAPGALGWCEPEEEVVH